MKTVIVGIILVLVSECAEPDAVVHLDGDLHQSTAEKYNSVRDK